jgi:NhaA family Na+:H+ antiporter
MRNPERSPRLARLVRPFEAFFRLEAASGIVLLVAAAAAIIWANSPWGSSYFHLWELRVRLGLGDLALAKTLHHWINDGLMAVFFFVVGLEIKREVMVGELAVPRRAALAVAAAVGGMVVPALLYALLNRGGAGAAGWGIPMATDIAFALGVLALLGSRVPLGLKVFLTAVAIVDDLGAVLVIALFYTAELSIPALGAAAGLLLALIIVNRMGVRAITPYLVIGALVWLAVLKSGIHATVAGVLVAMTIPASAGPDAPPGKEAPLETLEHQLHAWVGYLFMPIFALANAGVSVGGSVGAAVTNPVFLGIVAGLIVGKQVGVTLFAWLAVRTGLASLPADVSWRQIYGAGWLAGIGFTMSLFIAGLAFDDEALLSVAKLGILTASVVAGVVGWLLLRSTGRPT